MLLVMQGKLVSIWVIIGWMFQSYKLYGIHLDSQLDSAVRHRVVTKWHLALY